MERNELNISARVEVAARNSGKNPNVLSSVFERNGKARGWTIVPPEMCWLVLATVDVIVTIVQITEAPLTNKRYTSTYRI